MIFLDMDGTLLDSHSEIKEESKKILKKLKNDGKIIVIVTGRILSSAMPLLDSDFVDYILSNNGARWYSYKSDQVIHENILNNDILCQFLLQYQKYLERIDIATTYWEKFYEQIGAIDFINQNSKIYQVSLKVMNCDILDLLKQCEKSYPQLDFQIMQDSFSEKQWLNILYKNINKGKSITEFSKFLHYPLESAICFGDGLNDISMLEVCGISVAMGNALKEVKEKAKYVTNSNDDNGIYKFLYHYFYEEV